MSFGISKSGDITFDNTIDGATAATQSLSLTAGTGSITFNKAIGSGASLIELKVNIAQTVTAKSEITTNSNITITATSDITTAQLSSDNGVVKLTSKQGAVTTTEITSGSATTIAASQSISTGSISALGGAVSLTSLQSSITTSDITTDSNVANSSKGDITLKAATNITTTNLSANGSGKVNISLQSDTTAGNQLSGNVTTGRISAKQIKLFSTGSVTVNDDITTNAGNLDVVAASDVTTHKISSSSGAVSLNSCSGSVTTDGDITARGDVHLIAGSDVTTDNILSSQGEIGLCSSSGAVTAAGELTAKNDVYVVASQDVDTSNIQTQGGRINLTSLLGAVKTGFLRSDKASGTGGDIDVQAASRFRATGSLSINGTNYSIYTGTTGEGEIAIAYGGAVAFVIGDARTNGTAAALSTGSDTIAPAQSFVTSYRLGNIDIISQGASTASDKDLMSGGSTGRSQPQPIPIPFPWIDPKLIYELPPQLRQLWEERLRSIFEEPGNTPTLEDVMIDPITGKRYRSVREYELVSELTDVQKQKLHELIHDTTKKQSLKEEDLPKGKVDTTSGCFSIELDKHLGGYQPHNVYAAWVTGSKGDFFMMEPQKANYAFYDGKVKEKGRAFKQGFEPLAPSGSKNSSVLLIKAATGQQLSAGEQHNKEELEIQLYYRDLVAERCGCKFFLSFDNRDVAIAAKKLYSSQYPNVAIHYIKPGFPTDVYGS